MGARHNNDRVTASGEHRPVSQHLMNVLRVYGVSWNPILQALLSIGSDEMETPDRLAEIAMQIAVKKLTINSR